MHLDKEKSLFKKSVYAFIRIKKIGVLLSCLLCMVDRSVLLLLHFLQLLLLCAGPRHRSFSSRRYRATADGSLQREDREGPSRPKAAERLRRVAWHSHKKWQRVSGPIPQRGQSGVLACPTCLKLFLLGLFCNKCFIHYVLSSELYTNF